MAASPLMGLGIDAGGTRTRWALATTDGPLVAEGEVEGLSALQATSDDGRISMHAAFSSMATAVLAHGQPQRVVAGLTGFGGGDGGHLERVLSELLGLPQSAIALSTDIEIACRANFAPGEGYLIYAGTGSIGAFIDAGGEFHRAGGRGVTLDDGGGGFWIAREALRHIWRKEDEQPGSWRSSPMAHAVFDHIGGDDWALTRQFIYGQDRGAVGTLALAVAASADADPAAAAILAEAGRELARLARALTMRFGDRPLVLAGRASTLHPSIHAAMRSALPETARLTQADAHAHHAAARIAARAISGTTPP
ncbi:MAG: BadF/BadG/BcrA/BcrD ATPase family protein [Massilia sp.]